MDEHFVEYIITNPSNKQIDTLKYLYSSMLKQLEAIQQFKDEEIHKIQAAYDSNDDDENIQLIMNKRTLVKQTIDNIAHNLFILENYLFKDYIINADISETNICPTCDCNMGSNTLHYVLFNKDKSNIIGRDYTKSCFCHSCKKRYIPKTSYEDVLSKYDINYTNIVVNKLYYIPDSDIYTIIVVANTLPCSSNKHMTKDIVAKFPAVNEKGELIYPEISALYCFDCKKFTILKENFNSIKDIIMCKIIDETVESKLAKNDEIEIEQKKSLLYYYGYNVQTKKNLSEKQRQIILSSIIEANLMNRRDISNHLITLISRGSKVPKWKTATQKWKQDKEFVSNYKLGSLPSVIFDKIIKKYTYSSSV